MRDLVPLKVKIKKWGKEATGDHKSGHSKYPDFALLPVVIESGVVKKGTKEPDWSTYVDMFGLGWMYDKVAGHDEEDEQSPSGTWVGCLVVDKVFVDQAVAMFPDTCTKLTEVELEDFYDNRAAVKLPEMLMDEEALLYLEVMDKNQVNEAGYKVKKDKALNPDDAEPGIRKNHAKTWKLLKAKKGIRIVQ